MRSGEPVSTDLVLLGAGHAHVEVLRRFGMRPEPGVRLTLIGREPETPYTGMLPGLIRGDYAFEQAHIDLAPLAVAAGARLILAEATAIDLTRTSGDGDRPPNAFRSTCCRSISAASRRCRPNGGQPVKPIGQFLARLSALETDPVTWHAYRCRSVAEQAEPNWRWPWRDAIAAASASFWCATSWSRSRRAILCAVRCAHRPGRGGGGVCLRGPRRRLGGWPSAIVGRQFPGSCGRALGNRCRGAGIAAGVGLACDAAGCVQVDGTLQSLSHAFVFAAGDCAAIEGNPRPKAGVWAVRAGRPLAANLRRAAVGRKLRRWRPQSDALAIIGLGDGRALAWRNGVALAGRSIWRWKDWIDRRWMRMYQRPMAPMDDMASMRCGGCGAKVGAEDPGRGVGRCGSACPAPMC